MDPFTTDSPLMGPATLRGRQLITFATGLGPGLLLLSVYDSPAGAVAVGHPTDFGQSLGDPMLNFAPSVGEQTRLAVPDAQALLLVWPTSGHDPHPLRITFERGDQEHTPAGPTTVVVSDDEAAPTVLRADEFTSRFAGTTYGHTSFEALHRIYGDDVDLELSHAEVDDLARGVPGGTALAKAVLARKGDAADSTRALLREFGLYGPEEV